MINKQESESVVEFRAFPTRIALIPVAFILVGTIALVFKDHNLKAMDMIIYYGVCLAGLLINKHKTILIDKKEKTLTLKTKAIIKIPDKTLKIEDIKGIEMSYGRGAYARGGCITITDLKEERIIIMDSGSSSLKKIKEVKKEIELIIKK